MTSSAVAAMKSPMVAKCRNSAPSDTWARLAITAADARAYPTSTIVSMHASSSRATVSSRRCCWVLAMSDTDLRGETGIGPKEVTRLHGRPVTLAELAVAVHDGPADTRRDHCGVVAVDHPAQAAVERDLLLVVAVDRRVEAFRVDHDEVGAVALTQGARVEAEPLGDLGGEAMNRALGGEERMPGAVGVAHSLQQTQREVVEGHVTKVRTGIREAHVDGRLGGQLVEILGPVIPDDGGPADVALPVVDEHVEEGVERMQSALDRDLPEALADQRRVRAFDDDRVVKVAVPQRRTELLAVERAPEPAAVLLVGEQFVALQLIAQMQRGGACAELLEDGQIDSVGVQLERNRQMLEADERSEQLVDQPDARAEHVNRGGRRLGVGRHQQAHPDSGATSEHAATG